MHVQSMLVLLVLLLPALLQLAAAIPSTPHYFAEQRIDHFGTSEATFTQRYYSSDTHFKGPGHPIFVVIGGEGAVPPSTGLFYPFVVDDMAAAFSALVVQPEHRFYGTSLPFGDPGSFTDEHLNLMTAEQALADTAHFALATQRAHNCSATRGTPGYCPIVTVGGSYPGWLSAMMRLRYPVRGNAFFEVIDTKNVYFTKTGSGQTQGKLNQRSVSAGGGGHGILRLSTYAHVRPADRPGKKTRLLRHFVNIKTIILPRQAGDKHGETLKKLRVAFSSSYIVCLLQGHRILHGEVCRW
jgi:hypothetical protein